MSKLRAPQVELPLGGGAEGIEQRDLGLEGGKATGEPVVDLKRARRLVERVEATLYDDDDDAQARHSRLARRFREAGGHSVSRAILWSWSADVVATHGMDGIYTVVTRTASSWLSRQELRKWSRVLPRG